jgi:HTH-type transcriptional regulator, competence development regulator
MTRSERKPILAATGARIRRARLDAGLNLQEFARLTGLSISALSLIETGKRDPRLTTLAVISDALRVGLPHLVGETRSDGAVATETGSFTGSETGAFGARGYDLEEYE